jgi:peptide deformylase
MTPFSVLRWPDPRLKLPAFEVTETIPNIKEIVDKMILTMVVERGIGLAATQVGIFLRIIVMLHKGQPIALINPKVDCISNDKQKLKEGCLSFPGIFEHVERARGVSVISLDTDRKEQRHEFSGLEATCFLHELDHLEGKVFTHYLSPIRRALINKKMHDK